MIKKDKTLRILQYLKDKDWTSTTQIFSRVTPRMNFYEVTEALDELHTKGKIQKQNAGRLNYWRVTRFADGGGS